MPLSPPNVTDWFELTIPGQPVGKGRAKFGKGRVYKGPQGLAAFGDPEWADDDEGRAYLAALLDATPAEAEPDDLQLFPTTTAHRALYPHHAEAAA